MKSYEQLITELRKRKDDPCWDGYTQVGTKKKRGKEVPNCVPLKEEDLQQSTELLESDDDKNVTLNKPFRTPNGPKKFAVYVKNSEGKTVIVRFGDPNAEIKTDDAERRKNFRARHNCSDQKDKTTPAYWSCKMWSTSSVKDHL